jgi:AraC-like DNA-binding protein
MTDGIKPIAVYRFEYDHIDYEQLLHDMALSFNVPVAGNMFYFPPEVADGFLKTIILPNELPVMIYNLCFKTDFDFIRKKIKEEYYTLRFEEFEIPGRFEVKMDNNALQPAGEIRAAVMLTSCMFNLEYVGEKGTMLKGMNILLSRDWMAKYLGVASTDAILQKYLSLKIGSYDAEPMDGEYRRLFYEIIGADEKEHPLKKAVIHNRIMLLVERFFTRLYSRLPSVQMEIKLTRETINRIIEAEAELVKSFSDPAPTIAVLARKTSMSTSKLKKSFKEVFGLPIYEYFQKKRMNMARLLLISGNYSVKKAGMEMGYNNLSNFAIAFKKEFGLLPSEFIQAQKHKG